MNARQLFFPTGDVTGPAGLQPSGRAAAVSDSAAKYLDQWAADLPRSVTALPNTLISGLLIFLGSFQVSPASGPASLWPRYSQPPPQNARAVRGKSVGPGGWGGCGGQNLRLLRAGPSSTGRSPATVEHSTTRFVPFPTAAANIPCAYCSW
eukprot:GHVT01076553.1.p1 GENE.GHVT01076553.1~~GHVT01076553.1.p1  ORF type:complete len:176 (-),score=18.00 GHVT01076553.1:707-1159(-)